MSNGAGTPVLDLRDVSRTYVQGSVRLEVLHGVSLAVSAGQMVALVGPSGAGKSTLLHLAGLLERPDRGDILIDGQSAAKLSDDQRTRIRRARLGFVYQYHHLLPEFSALENVAMPQLIAGISRRKARKRAVELLEALGLGDRLGHRPGKLSGGEQQRVAIGRALANGPILLLADEPTGNLDHSTADRVFDQLRKLVHTTRIGALVATHNLELATRMDRVLSLEDGSIVPL